MTLIWYINSEQGTRTSVSYLKLHCSLESVDWKNFIILRLQLILVGFILAYYIGKKGMELLLLFAWLDLEISSSEPLVKELV